VSRNVGYVFFFEDVITTFAVGLPGKIKNPVPASQVGFQQIRVIEHFFVKGSNKCSACGAL